MGERQIPVTPRSSGQRAEARRGRVTTSARVSRGFPFTLLTVRRVSSWQPALSNAIVDEILTEVWD